MDLNNKQVALLAAFIIITGAVSFNILGITGSATKTNQGIIDITPLTVQPGENTQIIITPGTEGTSNKAEFFTNGKKVGETPELCQEQRCHEKTVIIYDIPRTWKQGNYIVHIFDYDKEHYAQDYFILK
ncbi:MAG TPA: hypothetical protein VJB87_05000 [Candidatus Nanoarchaeia archaeon]|nr:hypothetical protein [Candidatus Nanoarchaeia archaeon]